MLTCVEICAGAGGQALGLDMAGFHHIALVEYEKEYCAVLKENRPQWNVICADVRSFDGRPYQNVDLLAGGVPCPPFSIASKQLGQQDERDLFPEAIRLIGEMHPRAVMLENVRGLLDAKFDTYRNQILTSIQSLGYVVFMKLLNACDYGVPQLRPRVVIVAIREDERGCFSYPEKSQGQTATVGRTLKPLMSANGWKQAETWTEKADKIAPTIVGGSKKHGGPDLGPVRARRAWAGRCQHSSAAGISGNAKTDQGDDRPDSGLSSGVAFRHEKNGRLPYDRKRLPAAGGKGCRHPDQEVFGKCLTP